MRRYWRVVVPLGIVAAVVAVLVMTLSSNLVYFNTPTEILETGGSDDRMRLGGEVVEGSVEDTVEGVQFMVTDGRQDVMVTHLGAPQQLFQEGIGVVVEGTWNGAYFASDMMLVKHDEQYRTEDGDVYELGEMPGAGEGS